MRHLSETVRGWLDDGTAGVVVRPVSEHGLGARNAEHALAISEGGATAGGLYGGAADAAIREGAARVLADGAARVLDVSVSDPEAVAAGLVCGGHARLLAQPLSAIPPAWWGAVEGTGGAVLLTGLDGPSGAVVVSAGAVEGELGGDLDEPAVQAARRALRRGRGTREVLDVAGRQVLVEGVAAPPRVVVVGSGELAAAISRQARLLDWDADVVDAAGDAEALLSRYARTACLVMLSHDPEVSIPVLAAALAAPIPYVGALGSRHTQAARAGLLRERGVGDDLIGGIRGPVGLDLGARSPQETALAVCAEIMSVLNGREPVPIRDTAGPVNR